MSRRRVSILNRQKAKANSVFSIQEANEVDMIFAQDENDAIGSVKVSDNCPHSSLLSDMFWMPLSKIANLSFKGILFYLIILNLEA